MRPRFGSPVARQQSDAWQPLPDAPFGRDTAGELAAKGLLLTAHRHVGDWVYLEVRRPKAPPPRFAGMQAGHASR